MDGLLGVKDVAKLLGIRRQDVGVYVAEGRIEVVRLPGRKRVKFTREAVDAFIRSCAVGPAVGPLSETATEPNVEIAALSERGQRLPKTAPYQWTQRYARK
jgi:excisionase family DNA binding protein